MSGEGEQIAADTLSRLRDFTQRLEVSGGDLVSKSTINLCKKCRGASKFYEWLFPSATVSKCSFCHGTGVVRVRSGGLGN